MGNENQSHQQRVFDFTKQSKNRISLGDPDHYFEFADTESWSYLSYNDINRFTSEKRNDDYGVKIIIDYDHKQWFNNLSGNQIKNHTQSFGFSGISLSNISREDQVLIELLSPEIAQALVSVFAIAAGQSRQRETPLSDATARSAADSLWLIIRSLGDDDVNEKDANRKQQRQLIINLCLSWLSELCSTARLPPWASGAQLRQAMQSLLSRQATPKYMRTPMDLEERYGVGLHNAMDGELPLVFEQAMGIIVDMQLEANLKEVRAMRADMLSGKLAEEESEIAQAAEGYVKLDDTISNKQAISMVGYNLRPIEFVLEMSCPMQSQKEMVREAFNIDEYDRINKEIPQLVEAQKLLLLANPMLARVDPHELVSAKDNPAKQRTLLAAALADIIDGITATQANIASGSLDLWSLDALVSATISEFGLDEKRQGIIHDRQTKARRDKLIMSLGLAALQIGLAIGASFVNPALGVALAVSAFGIGVADAVYMTGDYKRKRAASKTAIDPNQSLINPEELGSDGLWVVASWVGVGMDLGAAVQAFKLLRQTKSVAKVLEGFPQLKNHQKLLDQAEELVSSSGSRFSKVGRKLFDADESVSAEKFVEVLKKEGFNIELAPRGVKFEGHFDFKNGDVIQVKQGYISRSTFTHEFVHKAQKATTWRDNVKLMDTDAAFCLDEIDAHELQRKLLWSSGRGTKARLDVQLELAKYYKKTAGVLDKMLDGSLRADSERLTKLTEMGWPRENIQMLSMRLDTEATDLFAAKGAIEPTRNFRHEIEALFKMLAQIELDEQLAKAALK